VVETEPAPPRTDESVTVYFNAEEGTGGLEGHDGAVYAHTGISTNQNPEEEWKCVKNHWPTSDQFTGNRDDTQLTQVDGDPNRYRLEIADIRAYYQNTSTTCSLGDDEKIETMNLVFRNADGSKEGKASGGSDIFVDVVDVSGSVPVVATTITNPTGNPPLYPFIASTDTTVTVSVSADTANVKSLDEVRLFVDGTQVASSTTRSLSYDLAMDTPNRYQIRAETEATSGDSTIVDSTSTFFIRTPSVVDEARPPGVQDGINYNSDGSVTLSLYAPNKEFVYAIGDFTDWEIDGDHFMKRHQAAPDSTHWWITLDNLNSGQEYAYQYFVDGELRLGDPFAHKVLSPQDESLDPQALGFSNLKPYPGDETENLVSVLEPGQDDFNFSEFTPPEHSEMVVYELLLRDFLETNSYAALTDTLDYLDRLGVNAIELMPVSNFGGNESWGYNPNFHLALDKAYGPPEDLKQFVEAAHQRGIAILLDVVYNHATNQSPLVQMYGTSDTNPWLNVPASSPFSVFNQLNHGNAFVKHYIDRASTYWLEEFNVDGFRFDLSKGFISGQPENPNGYQPQRIDNLQRIADHVWSVDPEAHVILEHFGVPQEEQELSAYRADETGGMMLWNNMNEPYNQVAMGFEEGSDISGTYYANRGLDNPNYMTYMESHDEQWLMRRNKLFGNSSGDYSVQDLQTALNRQKLVGAFFFPVPGPRMMWQFGELGYGWGPEECLKPGGGGDGDCAAGDPGRTAPKPIRWEYRDPAQNPDRVRLYKTWSALLDLRSDHDVFTSPNTSVTIATAGGERTRRLQLQHDSMDAVVVGNVGVTRQEVRPEFPSTGAWYDYFTGDRVNIESEEQDAAVSMAPGEFHVYTSAPVDTPEAGLVPYDAVAPAPAAPTSLEAAGDLDAGVASLSWAASTAGDVTGYQVYRGTAAAFDTTGARIATVGPEATSYVDSTVTEGTAYYYRVVSRDNDGMRSEASSSARVLLRPSTVEASVSRSFGAGSAKSDYRLVALPGQVSRGLGDTFQGTAGDAWQAYWDDGSAEDYLQQFDGSSTFDLSPGHGFWAISESTWSVEDEFTSVSLVEDAGRQVAIINLRQGWNIISNPLGIDIPWSRVEQANDGALQPLWRFDGSFSQASTFVSARSGEAFYFHNQEGRARLKIPYSTGTTESEAASAQKASLLTLTARGSEGRPSTVQVGTSPDARDGVGTEDVVAPPSQFEALSLRVQADDGEASPRTRSLAQSVRAAGTNDEGEVYELSLRATSDAPVRLSVENAQAAGTAVRLVNRQTGASHDLRTTSSLELTPTETETEWTLLTGSESFVEREASQLHPESVTLWPNYPNPFREQTTIEYTLPEAGDVRLEVYDLLGRRVQVLVDGRHQEGLHRVSWNGRNGSGATAASGIYIVRLQANGTTRSRKMTLVR